MPLALIPGRVREAYEPESDSPCFPAGFGTAVRCASQTDAESSVRIGLAGSEPPTADSAPHAIATNLRYTLPQ